MLKVGLEKKIESNLNKPVAKKGCGCGRKGKGITKITKKERQKIIADKMNKVTSSIDKTKAIF